MYCLYCFLFFNGTATTLIYTYGHTLSLHDALPILLYTSICLLQPSRRPAPAQGSGRAYGSAIVEDVFVLLLTGPPGAGKSSVLTALHDRLGERSEEHTSELQSLMRISYAVFCLKKKNKTIPFRHIS